MMKLGTHFIRVLGMARAAATAAGVSFSLLEIQNQRRCLVRRRRDAKGRSGAWSSPQSLCVPKALWESFQPFLQLLAGLSHSRENRKPADPFGTAGFLNVKPYGF